MRYSKGEATRMLVTTAKVTTKGQVTIPKEIRAALKIGIGDLLEFRIEGSHAILSPIKKRSLLDFQGVFPASRPFTSHAEIRAEARKKQLQRLAPSATEQDSTTP